MADHRGALRAARPILAGAVFAGRKRGAVRLRSRQHIVAVRRVAGTADDLALFGERGLLGEVVAGAVQFGDVLGDHRALGILPRPLADAIARIDGRLTVGGLRREVGAPGLAAGSGRLRQCLAVIIRAGEPAEVAAIADAVAGQEETGIGRLRLRGRGGGNRYGRNGEACWQNDSGEALHLVSPCRFLFRWHQHITATIIPVRNEAAILAKKKAPRNEPQRLSRHVVAISWSAGSPRVPNRRRGGGRRSKLR